MKFEDALEEILDKEGGYVDHPKDPGGATNMGITLATLRRWRANRPTTKADVRALTRGEAGEIYRAYYWTPAKCGGMPAGLGLLLFDAAVNHGVRGAVRMLQEAVGPSAGAQDGIVGKKTLGAIRAKPLVALIDEFCAVRADLYESINETFERGWFRRLFYMHRRALEEANLESVPAQR